MFDNFSFRILQILLSLFTASVGGLFLLMAWTSVLLDFMKNARRGIPMSVYLFTGGVFLELTWIVMMKTQSFYLQVHFLLGMEMATVLWWGLTVSSLALLIISIILVRREAGPGRLATKIGSGTLVAGFALALILMNVTR
jgi:hypothetical protein